MGPYDWLILSLVVFLAIGVVANAVFLARTKKRKDE